MFGESVVVVAVVVDVVIGVGDGYECWRCCPSVVVGVRGVVVDDVVVGVVLVVVTVAIVVVVVVGIVVVVVIVTICGDVVVVGVIFGV